VRDGKIKHWGRTGHELPDLAAQVGIPWTQDENYLFERLADSVKWTAKYAIPMTAEGMLPRSNQAGAVVGRGGMSPLDPTLIEQVWSTLHTVLEENRLAARPQQAIEYRERMVADALGHAPA
jgi:hypothetical protein